MQLVLAMQDASLSKDENDKWVKKRGLLIAPNQLHECDAINLQILSLDIDPESSPGEWITKKHLAGQKVIDFPLHVSGKIVLVAPELLLNQTNFNA